MCRKTPRTCNVRTKVRAERVKQGDACAGPTGQKVSFLVSPLRVHDLFPSLPPIPHHFHLFSLQGGTYPSGRRWFPRYWSLHPRATPVFCSSAAHMRLKGRHRHTLCPPPPPHSLCDFMLVPTRVPNTKWKSTSACGYRAVRACARWRVV